MEPQPNTKLQGCTPLLLEQVPGRTCDPLLASKGGWGGGVGPLDEVFAVPEKVINTSLKTSSPLI